MAWFGMLGFFLSTSLPGLQGFVLGFGVINLLLMGYLMAKHTPPHMPSGTMRFALYVFLLIGLITVLYPPLILDLYPLRTTLTTYWHTIRAVVGAGVVLWLLRSSRSVLFPLLLSALFLLVWMAWSHASVLFIADHSQMNVSNYFWLYRLVGNSNVLSTRLYLFIVCGVVAISSSLLRGVRLQGWMHCIGYALCGLLPLPFLLNLHPSCLAWLSLDRHDVQKVLGYGIVPLGILIAMAIGLVWKRSKWAGVIGVAAVGVFPVLAALTSDLARGEFLLLQISTGIVLLCCAAWFFLCRGGTARTFCIVVLILMGYATIILVNSRQGIIIVPIFITFTLLLRHFSLPRVVIPVVACTCIAALAWAALDFPGSPDTPRARLHPRQIIWNHSIKIGMESPLLGHGYGFRAYKHAWLHQEVQLPESIKDDAFTAQHDLLLGVYRSAPVYHAHNLILQIFVERGLIGVLSVLFLWGSVVGFLWGALRRHTDCDAVKVILLFFLLVPLQQLVDYTMWGTAESTFWIVFALFLACTKHSLKPGASPETHNISCMKVQSPTG